MLSATLQSLGLSERAISVPEIDSTPFVPPFVIEWKYEYQNRVLDAGAEK